tara:strand:+ start:328 stop:2226 length:1899 start_codon:yes stop_codon:yes gene_type:complete
MLLVLVSLMSAMSSAEAGTTCKKQEIKFILLDGDATLAAVEDDISAELEKVGFTLTKSVLQKDAFNTAMTTGDFHLAFSETWGPPYDPHSYAKSWGSPDEAYFAALKGLPAPNTQAVLMTKIDTALTQETETKREEKWSEILKILHEQATELPFSGKRIPAVINNRLSSYQNGPQQFDYPLHTLRVVSGSQDITVAPGAQTGLFTGVGRLDPHSYRPNEFFANNLVYDGLVEYGAGGIVKPALAASWTVAENGAGQTYTFQLRTGVTFHDGAAWDCAAAKLNFDHVLSPALTTGDYHGWYGLPGQISSWSCTSSFVFVINTKSKYYPLLQELTYIRPLRMLSPLKFVGGASSDPITQNSCPTGWGNVTGNSVTITCAGTLGIAGTGRWSYTSTTNDGNGDLASVLFARNTNHWDVGAGTDVVNNVRLVRYADHAAVKAALLANSLDMVVGAGVLTPADVAIFKSTHTATHSLYLTEPIQNRIIIFNTNKAPTNILETRKVIIHAVDKAAIIKKELGLMGQSVDSLFPKTAPYCDVSLTPRWDYDLEKAKLLNCPADAAEEVKFSKDSITVIVLIAVLGAAFIGLAIVALVVSVGVTMVMAQREKQGRPLFKPLLDTSKVGGQVELETVTSSA